MREVKFRGIKKSPYGDKWVYGYYTLQDGQHVIIMPHVDSYKESVLKNEPIPAISVLHDIDVKTLGQYTGLKDKNGKEIYEGDIVKVFAFGDYKKGYVKYNEIWGRYDIGWMNEIEKYKNNEVVGSFAFMKNDYDLLEIVGNIYENPELIN